MKYSGTILLVAIVSVVLSACNRSLNTGIASQGSATTSKLSIANRSWIGVYTSPEEIGGYSGTVLVIEEGYENDLHHKMLFYSDVSIVSPGRRSLDQPEKRGDVIVDGDKLYAATASGYLERGNADLSGNLEKYTRLQLKDRTVLMRDDALQAYRKLNQLYDYGILIKVADTVDLFFQLSDAKHESIKVLYENPQCGWADPFLNGPNKR